MSAETIYGAILGTILSFLVPLIWDWIMLLRSPVRPSPGAWMSQYQMGPESKEWIDEIVEISYRLGRMKLEGVENERGYHWVGKAKIVDKRFLVGELHSAKPGARTLSRFVLTIDQQGNCLYGRWIKPNTRNVVTTGCWVLGKEDADIDIAKKRIS